MQTRSGTVHYFYVRDNFNVSIQVVYTYLFILLFF